MVPLKIVSNVSRFKPALNLNRVLADLNRGSNSLNSISEIIHIRVTHNNESKDCLQAKVNNALNVKIEFVINGTWSVISRDPSFQGTLHFKGPFISRDPRSMQRRQCPIRKVTFKTIICLIMWKIFSFSRLFYDCNRNAQVVEK